MHSFHQHSSSAHPPAIGSSVLPQGGSQTVALAAPIWIPHPHAVVGRVHQSGARAFLDVAGGILFAVLVSLCMIRVTQGLFMGAGWGASIGWESVWILATIACAPLLPSGIIHDVTRSSTIRGLALDWPELVFSLYTLIEVLRYGINSGVLGPLGLALAVGTAEEFLFRVLILGWLVTRMRPERALLVSAVIFGLAHLQSPSLVGLLSIAPQTSGGVVLGAIYLRTRNPLGPILGHAAWDFPIFLGFGLGVSGGSTEAGMPSVLSLMPWIALTIYGLFLIRHGVGIPGRAPRDRQNIGQLGPAQ